MHIKIWLPISSEKKTYMFWGVSRMLEKNLQSKLSHWAMLWRRHYTPEIFWKTVFYIYDDKAIFQLKWATYKY